MKISRWFGWIGLAVGIWLTLPQAHAYKIAVTGDTFLDVKLYLQGWLHLNDTGSPDKDNFAAQVYLRRARLMISGQITERIKFLYGTLHSDFGKDGDYSSKSPIDALTAGDFWIAFDFGKALTVDFGFLLIPFLHNFRQGGATFMTLDYHTPMRKIPVGSHFVGRDMGAGVRGTVANDYLSYFVQVSRGLWAQDGAPRITARAVLNLLEPETDFFYAGTYLGKKKIFSLGVALDLQPLNGGLDKENKLTTYYAIGGDLFLDYPIGKNGVTAQINIAYYKNSIGNASGKTCSIKTPDTCKSVSGLALLSEFGWRMDKVSIVAGLDWFGPEGAADVTAHHLGFLVGLIYWIKGHQANLKLQYNLAKEGGATWEKLRHDIIFQAQILFS